MEVLRVPSLLVVAGALLAGCGEEERGTNPLEPKVLEFKFYARGVGPVLAISVSGGSGREELLSYKRGR